MLTGRDVAGASNSDVATYCDAAILAIPSLDEASFLNGLRKLLARKIVLSPIVPMSMDKGLLTYSKTHGSAAEAVAAILKESRIVAALHNVPALTLTKMDRMFDFDVPVACDSRTDYEEASAIIASVEGLRPLYVGPLSISRTLESITPLLINTAKLNKLTRLSLKMVS